MITGNPLANVVDPTILTCANSIHRMKQQVTPGRSGRVARIILKVASAAAFLVTLYIWFVMSLHILSWLDGHEFQSLFELGVDYSSAYALDSLCSLLLILGYLGIYRSSRVLASGLIFSSSSFLLRLLAERWGDSMFWFEPYTRSGIYVVALILFHAAYRTPSSSQST